jgi:CRP-like cAMP-binding protein
MDAVAAHPVAELLDCPPETGSLLAGAAQCLSFDCGEVVFHQDDGCKGLYLVLSGQFVRKAERLNARVTLERARAGDFVELAAALGNSRHTFTLRALTPGTLMLLPADALRQAFESYPALRMRLLEEQAREVCRAYLTCRIGLRVRTRRRSHEPPAN